MIVQSFITIKLQEKKLSIMKIFNVFVSDHLKVIHIGSSENTDTVLLRIHALILCNAPLKVWKF